MADHDYATLRKTFEAAGQGHVFQYFDELDDAGKEKLLVQAASVDLEELQTLIDTLVKSDSAAAVDLSELEPAAYIPIPRGGTHAGHWTRARTTGEEALRGGRVAAFTVAGGQGTRLGFHGPKGSFPVTPVRQAALFQVFAEKIRASAERYSHAIPWYVMTSQANHDQTLAFFEQNGFFGLAREDLCFFAQGMMPAVDFDGRIILESKDSMAMSPDGHGGSLRALRRSGSLQDMARRGVDTISYFQVDNPLVHCIDPEFIGFHILGKSEMSSKTIPKAYPEEKLGHFCRQRGKTVVIEYSDLPDEMARKTDESGQLRFRAGSIAIHVLDRAFVERVGGGDAREKLPFHRAKKKVPALASNGETVKPAEPNGIKFEMFVFDALPQAQQPVIVETERFREFSPVKNAEGLDSPESCRQDQLKLFAHWLAKVGHDVPKDDDGVPEFNFEVTPLFGDCEESFIESWRNLIPKPSLTEGFVL